MRFWPLVLMLLMGTPAFAGHQVSLGVSQFTTRGFFRSTVPRYAVEAAYSYESAHWLLGGGVRWAFPRGVATVPLEAHGRFLFVARMGIWAPAVGPELGVSGLSVLDPTRINFPSDFRDKEDALIGPGYVALHAAPLRFSFQRFTVSALELQWGSTFFPLGTTLRLQLGLLQVGVKL